MLLPTVDAQVRKYCNTTLTKDEIRINTHKVLSLISCNVRKSNCFNILQHYKFTYV